MAIQNFIAGEVLDVARLNALVAGINSTSSEVETKNSVLIESYVRKNNVVRHNDLSTLLEIEEVIANSQYLFTVLQDCHLNYSLGDSSTGTYPHIRWDITYPGESTLAYNPCQGGANHNSASGSGYYPAGTTLLAYSYSAMGNAYSSISMTATKIS